MNKLIHLTLLFFLSTQGFGQSISKSEKLILKSTKLYRVSEIKGYISLEARDTLKQHSVNFKMPVEMPAGSKLGYDIYDRFIYAISILEYAPRQYSIFLIKSDLQKLDTLKKVDTVISTGKFKLYGSESMESHTKIAPLSSAIYGAQKDSSPVNYSLLLSANGMVELFILEGNQLAIWQLNKEEWKKSFTETCPFSGGFIAVENKGKRYMIADTGGIYEIAKKITEVIGKRADKDPLIIVDKNDGKIYSLPIPATMIKLQGISPARGKKIFEN